jgi:anti-sigma factor RsiW
MHCAYVDDTLAGVELVRMQRHIAECPECAEMDTRVRRSLMLVRNLPHIEPSADFSARLEARLRQCRFEEAQATRVSFRTVGVIGAVASVMMMAYMAESLHLSGTTRAPRDIVLPPVIAIATPPSRAGSLAVAGPDTSSVPMIVGSMSAGMPMWSAALLAEPGGLQTVSYTEAR